MLLYICYSWRIFLNNKHKIFKTSCIVFKKYIKRALINAMALFICLMKSLLAFLDTERVSNEIKVALFFGKAMATLHEDSVRARSWVR